MPLCIYYLRNASRNPNTSHEKTKKASTHADDKQLGEESQDLRRVHTYVGHFWYQIRTFTISYGLPLIGIHAQAILIRNVEIFTLSENATFATIRNLVQKCLKDWK